MNAGWLTERSAAVSLLLCCLPLTSFATINKDAEVNSKPSLETIVSRLVAANERRAQTLPAYRSKRFYHLDYHGFLGTHSAQLEVEVTYAPPDKKEFRVISQTGPKVLINRVLLKLLDSEKEASQQQIRTQTELSPRNYKFSLIQTLQTPGGNAYVLAVQPRDKSKFVYNGQIWVDGHDYAVTRMEGEPAKNPSLWISRTRIEYTWTNVDGFWLPLHTQSTTQVRLGGSAVLNIDYTDYQITGSGRTLGPRASDKSVLPDPQSMDPEQR